MHSPVPSLAPAAWRIPPTLSARARRWAARRLHRLSAWLRRLASRLLSAGHHSAGPAPQTLPRLEFHAEAGAPEGALYVDGEYVGRLDVRRL